TLGTFPNLACQKNEYLSGALNAFQSGGRNNPIMSPVAKGLSAADIRNLAAYFSGLSCRT
ncbi:MAG: cytochrome c, partial [Alphaproteobacteria bacterium]|nr:cytochrome c [Alphaproteobacteria bacterium]